MKRNKFKRYALMLSYEISSEEKEAAEKCLSYFDFLLRQIKDCDAHLDLLYTPFKDGGQNIDTASAWRARAALRRYRDRDVELFNKLKRIAFKCFALMQPFSSDTQIVKLNKSFVLAIGDLEKQVNRFVELFSDLKSKDFGTIVVAAITNIKKEISQLEEIVEERIKPYLLENILDRNWTENVSKELKVKVEKKPPMSIQLVEKREQEQ